MPPVGVANDSNDVINYAKHTINFSPIVAIYIFSLDKPMIVRSPLTSKAASDLRQTARLVCEAKGVPNVTFTW